MKRRSRGEQMLAAAGLAPASVLRPMHNQSPVKSNDDTSSPPAKRARPSAKAGSPAQTGQPRDMEAGISKPIEDKVSLPADFELLASMFDALRTGRLMLKRRSEKVTYNSVKHVVENLTKREFRVEHLAQMKHLRPESFDWQYIRVPSKSNPQQLELQLLLTFDQPASSCQEGEAGSVGKYNSAAEPTEFRAALEQYVRENPAEPATGKVPPVPQAQLPPRPPLPGVGPSRSGSMTQSALASPSTSAGGASGGQLGLMRAASCPAGMLADLQGAALPAGLASPSGSALSGASPAITRSRSRLGLPATAVPPSLTPIPEGSCHTPSRRLRRAQQAQQGDNGGAADGEVTLESDVGQGGAAGAATGAAQEPALELTQHNQDDSVTVNTAQRSVGVGGTIGCGGAAATPQSKGPRPLPLQVTPNSHRQGPNGENDPRLARLQSMLSPAAMQRIMEAEAAQAAQTPEAKRRVEMRRAVQLLPHGHELVRLVFGPQGPTVKPVTQVAQAMCERSTQRQGLTNREASNILVALARAVPDFLRIEEPRIMADGSARPRSVVISRAVNINAVAAKVKALAADPDAGVLALFERGGALPPAAAPSPGRSVLASEGSVPESPSGGLKPRALASALDGEPAGAMARQGSSSEVVDERRTSSEAAAGPSATAGQSSEVAPLPAMPPPPPSARKRPPGLPLAPASPMVRQGGQTPTRSQMLRSNSGLGAGPTGSLLASFDAQAAEKPDAAGEELLQKLCRLGASASAAAGGQASGELSSITAGAAAAVESCSNAQVRAGGAGSEASATELSGRTPGRVARTPGRTAVQEVMLNSARRSSAKRSCRKIVDSDAGGATEENAEDVPKPKRLEELLGD